MGELGEIIRCKHRIVSIENRGFNPDKLIFINHAIAGIISKNNIEYMRYDLEIDASDYYVCSYCKYFDNIHNMIEIGDDFYCENCQEELAIFCCDECQEFYLHECLNAKHIDGRIICEYCFSTKYDV